MTTLTPTAASDLFRRPPDRWVDVPGSPTGQVAVRTVGSGPDVLLVHGWPVSGATWRRVLPHLVDHVRCHVVDLVGAGQSRFDRSTDIDVDLHIRGVRAVIDAIGTDSIGVVGHDSGGLIARHAVAGDPRLRAVGLIDTEHTGRLSLLFRAFLTTGRLPGFGAVLTRAVMRPRLRRSVLVLGGAFDDPSLLDGEFEEFFLRPLRDDPDLAWACGELISSFDRARIDQLPELHRGITCPVQLVWGADDPFFPVAAARAMVDTFTDARLHVVDDARLFVHEERPEEVAAALLRVLG